jgi:hypothetical protein
VQHAAARTETPLCDDAPLLLLDRSTNAKGGRSTAHSLPLSVIGGVRSLFFAHCDSGGLNRTLWLPELLEPRNHLFPKPHHLSHRNSGADG